MLVEAGAAALHRRILAVLGTAAMTAIIAAVPASAAPDDGYGAPTVNSNQGGMSFPTIIAAQTFGPLGGSLDGEVAGLSLHLTIPAYALTSPTQVALAGGSASAAQLAYQGAISDQVVAAAVSITALPVAAGGPAHPIRLDIMPIPGQRSAVSVLISQDGAPGQIHELDGDATTVTLASLDAILLALMPPAAEPAIVEAASVKPTKVDDGTEGTFALAGDHPIAIGTIVVVIAAAAGVLLWRRRTTE